MKANEIRKMNAEQLNEKLTGLKKDLFMLRMQHATNQLDNPVTVSYTHLDVYKRQGLGESKRPPCPGGRGQPALYGKTEINKTDRFSGPFFP